MAPKELPVWTVSVRDYPGVLKALRRLSAAQIAQAVRAFQRDVQEFGLDIFSLQLAKWLGDGQCVLILSAYDKLRSPAKNRQQSEIAKARRIMKSL